MTTTEDLLAEHAAIRQRITEIYTRDRGCGLEAADDFQLDREMGKLKRVEAAMREAEKQKGAV